METFLPNGKYILTQQKFNELKANNQLVVGAEYEIITDDLDSKWYYVAPSLESITPPPAELIRSLILTPTETPSVFDMSTWNETEEEWVTFGTTTLSGHVMPINDWEEATNENIPSALLVKNEFEAFDELKLDDKLRETRTTQIIKDTNDHIAVGVKIDNGSLWTVDYEKPSNFEIPSTRYGVTRIGDKLYFVGGFTSYTSVIDHTMDRKPFNKILSFDVVTKTWAVEYEFDSYYYAFANNMVVAIGNDIYVMGATRYIRYRTNQAVLPFIPFKYNIISKTVTYLTANSGLRISNGAVYYNDKIYMPYGYYETITGRSYIETTETIFENSPLQHEIENATLPTNASEMQSLYDISNFDVATQDGMVVKVYNNSSAVYFRVGYTTITGIESNDLNIYTVSTNTWSTGATPPVLNDSRRHQGTSILVNGVIYVKRSSFFASYNIETTTWTTLAEPYIGSVHGENPQFHDGYIYYAGGWVGYATTSTPESQYNSSLITRYKIADNTWEAHSLLPQLNNHEQGYGCLYLIGDDLYYLSGYSNEYDGYPYTNPYVYKYDLTQGATYDEHYYNGLVIKNGMLNVPHDDTKADLTDLVKRVDVFLPYVEKTTLEATDEFYVFDGIPKKVTQANLLKDVVPKTAIKNNLTETAEGGVLDARQGKELDDKKLDKVTTTTPYFQVYVKTAGGLQQLINVVGNPVVNDAIMQRKNNGLFLVKSGNTASRPTTNLNVGDLYFNTELECLQVYDGNTWVNLEPYTLPQANETTLGGIKASSRNSETDITEVKIDPSTGKLYVPEIGIGVYSEDLIDTLDDSDTIDISEFDDYTKIRFELVPTMTNDSSGDVEIVSKEISKDLLHRLEFATKIWATTIGNPGGTIDQTYVDPSITNPSSFKTYLDVNHPAELFDVGDVVAGKATEEGSIVAYGKVELDYDYRNVMVSIGTGKIATINDTQMQFTAPTTTGISYQLRVIGIKF